MVGELIIKNIEEGKCATLGIALRNVKYKDKGYGTQAERLAVEYVFHELDIPTLYTDSILSNTRSQHVLEKVGFLLTGEDTQFKYYRIDRGARVLLDHTLKGSILDIGGGGELHIWDCDIETAYPEPFCIELVIQMQKEIVTTTYGVGKEDSQNKETITNMCIDSGLHFLCQDTGERSFYLKFRK